MRTDCTWRLAGGLHPTSPTVPDLDQLLSNTVFVPPLCEARQSLIGAALTSRTSPWNKSNGGSLFHYTISDLRKASWN